MEVFKLSDTLNKNRVFIIQRSDLEGRFDASIYAGNFVFKSNIYENRKLSDLAFINPTTSFATLGLDEEITFVPMEAVDEKFGSIKKRYTKKVLDSKGFTRFKENDLIWAKITPCMQNGKSAIVQNTLNGYACGSTEFFIVRPKSDAIRIEYIHFLLRDKRILNTAINYFGGTAGQQRVSKDFLLNFNVPFPPVEIQDKVILTIKTAYKQKQQKETEAETLLKSVDEYLSEELGIALPEKDNLLESRIFVTNFSNNTGRRLDPDYIKKYEYLISRKAKYDFVKLKDLLLKPPQYGANEEAVGWTSESEIRYIRITDIDEIGNLKQDRLKSAAKTDDRYLLKYNDILFARSGSVGKCYIHKDVSRKAIFAGYLIRFVINQTKANPDFIFYFCNSSIYKFWVSAIERPAVQSNINSEEYKSLPIPLPPVEKQNEIVSHIHYIRKKARNLQEEAKKNVEEANKEFEKVILGNSNKN